MADLAQKSAAARPTEFHELLATLHSKNTLLRVYTQNVDGLEQKSGLKAMPECGARNEVGACIPLHGCINQLRCQSCSSTFSLDPYLSTLRSGSLPPCDRCETTRFSRVQLNLRDRQTIPALKPDIILYGEDHPLAEEIAHIIDMDRRKIDLLLVVGTSMKVDGVQRVIRTFAQAVKSRIARAKATFLLPNSVYLNMDFPSQSKWVDIFQFWVKGDCEAFATMLQTQFNSNHSRNIIKLQTGPSGMSTIDGEEWGDDDTSGGSTLEQKMAFTNRRVDLRPLYRYF
jgi:NAD+-dependent protein deacetylase SIR2